MGPECQTLVRLVVFEVFHIFTPKIRKMIQFDEYFSTGLVQPPTIVVAVWESIDPMSRSCGKGRSFQVSPKKSHRKVPKNSMGNLRGFSQFLVSGRISGIFTYSW